MTESPTFPAGSIAVVGMSCRLPGARNTAELWDLVVNEREALIRLSERELRDAGVPASHLRHPAYVPVGSKLEGYDMLDAEFFGYTNAEADVMDPQQRFFLECSWEALEEAGHAAGLGAGEVGVFAGGTMSMYLFNLLADRFEPNGGPDSATSLFTSLFNENDYLNTQVSYRLNLTGPSVGILTTCSTSLAAVHMACQSLLALECDTALAGAASVRIPQPQGYFYLEDGPFSPDGHCRPFAASAAGSVFTQGVGVVALRRLEDAVADGDPIHAVIRGTAINNDGSDKTAFTAPSVRGQTRVVVEALAAADVDPRSISYIEAHGTATTLGDPIEVEALKQAFGVSNVDRPWCGLGSLNSNTGHTETASGVAGLIKTALAFQHGILPASLGVDEVNPRLGLDGSPFYVVRETQPWPNDSGPRRAGVTSLGFGGTNIHVVIEEPPAPAPASRDDRPQLVVLSARTPTALDATTERLATAFSGSAAPDLADTAHTLQSGRRAFRRRRFTVADSAADLAGTLNEPASARIHTAASRETPPQIVFMFPGMGSQYPGMGKDLYEQEPVFRAEIDRCAELLRPHVGGRDIRTVLYPADPSAPEAAEVLRDHELGQPAVFATSYALTRLFETRGVTPDAVIGHSLGEYVAATVSGVLSLENALALVAFRGRRMSGLPAGRMIAVALSRSELEPLLSDDLDMALVNAPSLCVVSGAEEAVRDLEERLEGQGVKTTSLQVNGAPHSRFIEPMMDGLREFTAHVASGKPRIPYLSNVTGTWITEEQAAAPDYWSRHLRETVDFDGGLRTILERPSLLVEVGPGTTLCTLARQQQSPNAVAITPLLPHAQETRDDHAVVLEAIGHLWANGHTIDWSALHNGGRRRVALPTYPFQRRRHWIQASRRLSRLRWSVGLAHEQPYQIPGWREEPLAIATSVPVQGETFLIVGVGDGLSAELATVVREQGGTAIMAQPAEHFAETPDGFELRLDSADDTGRLAEALAGGGRLPSIVVSLLGVDPGVRSSDNSAVAADGTSTLRLIRLVGALGTVRDSVGDDSSWLLLAVTDGAQQAEGSDRPIAGKAAAHAIARVMAQETDRLTWRTVDLPGFREAQEDPKAIADRLVTEVALCEEPAEVAYRGRRRLVRTWQHVRLPAHPLTGDESPVYLITGGLGHVGLRLAAHLYHTANARLVLTSRSGLPDETRWDSLPANTADEETARRVRQVRALRNVGAEILTVAADAADREAMASAVRLAEERFGRLDGVVHAAGVVGAEAFTSLAEMTADDLERHLRAKAEGAVVLRDVLAASNVRFCLLMSSVASIVGGYGLGAYAVANRFLDTFAAETDRPEQRWVTVAWDGWRVGGQGEDDPRAQTLMRHALDAEEALRAFDTVRGLLDRSPASLPPLLAVSPSDLAERSVTDSTPAAASATVPDELEREIVPPETDAERTIADLWSQELGVTEVSRHDDFFSLGGHSLVATRMLSQLRERFGTEIRLRDLYQNPTVASLAKMVDGDKTSLVGRAKDFPEITVVIRDGDARESLFCLHPSGGDILCYTDLARRLEGDHPVVGIQDPALADGEGIDGIPEMATRYLEAIQEIQPSGPYLLCGWSLGGIIAHQIACRLTAQGQWVGLLAMFDSNAPSLAIAKEGLSPDRDDAWLSMRYIRSLEAALDQPLLDMPAERFIELTDAERTAYTAQRLSAAGLLPESSASEELNRRESVFRRHLRSLSRHDAPTFTDGVLLFRSSQPSPHNSGVGMGVDDAFDDPELGWSQHVAGRIDIVRVPGHHYEILRPPAVEAVADGLNRALREIADRVAMK